MLHWEFASKFYLFDERAGGCDLDALIGPNLADTLGLKMRKIIDRQLVLAQHPAAQVLLPQAVRSAQALIKGWLFYPDGAAPQLDGIGADHAHGFWCTLAQVRALRGARFVLLPRLQWLAPLKVAASELSYSRINLEAALVLHFSVTPAPVLVALVKEQNGWLLEQERGFIVPDDWSMQAAGRRFTGLLPG